MPRERTLLAAGTTDTVSSTSFTVERYKPIRVGLFPEANLGSDTGVLQTQAPDDSWVTCTDDNGDIELSGTRTMEVVYGPGTYRIYCATRTSSWGVWATDHY